MALLLSGLLDLLNRLFDLLLEVRIAMPAPTPLKVLEPSVYMSMSVLCLCFKNSYNSSQVGVEILGNFSSSKYMLIF